MRQLKNRIPIENLMEEMADETGSEDIHDFADIFRIAKRTGGNMTAIMEHTASVITRRMEMKEEIAMAVASKKYEQQIQRDITYPARSVRICNDELFCETVR
jgi:tight adherence protein B